MESSGVKILSWNILAGGGRRAGEIVETISSHAPDIATLQEFRRGSAEDEIVAGLKKAGLKFINRKQTIELFITHLTGLILL